ncbi:MAG: TolC family protein [Deltaproteobacteria bacterium]|nr:TolC family protein [Deltaproteobacteria bacterium]
MGMRGMLRRLVIVVLICLTLCSGLSAAENDQVLTLQESIDLALKQSVMVHSAKEGVAGAEAQKQEAFTGFLPKLSTSYNYTRFNTDPYSILYGLSTPGSKTTMTTGTRDNYVWALEARQPVFAGGGILANYEVGRLGVDVARLDERMVTLDITREVRIAYFNTIKAEKLLDVAQQSVKQLESHRNTAQRFFDVGMIPRNDLLHAEVELANGQQFLVKSENGLELARSKLNTVLRRGIDTPVKVEDILAYKPFNRPLEDCVKVALDSRPEIRAYLLKVEQAKKMVSQAKSEFFPSVNLVGNYSRVGDTPGVSGSAYRDQENWYVMAVANWNFWEWGKTKNRVDVIKSRENQINDASTNARDQIVLEVKNAYLLLREAEKQIFVSKKAVEQAQENFRITEERYREQVATSTDVLDAQTLLTRAKSDHTNALGDYHISHAMLERAIGAENTGNRGQGTGN